MKAVAFTFKQLFALLFVTFIGLLAATALQAWTGPTSAAPGGNLAAPLNVGTTDQVKNGGLSVNTLGVFGSSYIQSKLGINNASPSAHLDIVGSAGTDGVYIKTTSATDNTSPWGIMLSNDRGLTAAGNAGYHGIEVDYAGNLRFERLSSVAGTPDLTITPAGNVGIGTGSPTATLDVHGTVKVFGARQGLSLGPVYGPAQSDGFVMVYGRCDGDLCPIEIEVYAGGNPPQNQVANGWAGNAGNYPGSIQISVPILKGEYYRILCENQVSCPGNVWLGAGNLYFVPFGQ